MTATAERTIISPRTATVKVYTGDYLDRIQRLERVIDETTDEPASAQRTNQLEQLRQEYDDLVAEADRQAVDVKVQALGRTAFRALVAKHPPRQAGADGATEAQALSDERVGMNQETFKDPFTEASVIEPAGLNLDHLSDIDFDRVYYAAYLLNRGVQAVPLVSLTARMRPQVDEVGAETG